MNLLRLETNAARRERGVRSGHVEPAPRRRRKEDLISSRPIAGDGRRCPTQDGRLKIHGGELETRGEDLAPLLEDVSKTII